jgi:hypothetical protein
VTEEDVKALRHIYQTWHRDTLYCACLRKGAYERLLAAGLIERSRDDSSTSFLPTPTGDAYIALVGAEST